MNKDKNYVSTITIIVSTGFSLFIIAQSFLSRTDQGEFKAALPLIIPALALVIPIAIVLITIILREIKYRKIVANGVKSVAFIRKVIETENYIKKQPEVKLDLDVIDDNGNKFFGEATTVVHFAELDLLKEGEPIPIIYSINNKKEISIDRKPDFKKLQDKIKNYKTQSNID